MGATFNPKSGSWKWYSGGIYGSGSWKTQETNISNVQNGDPLILAYCMHDIGGKAVNNQACWIYYATDEATLEAGGGTIIGAQGVTDKAFRMRNDSGLTDADPIPAAQLSCTTAEKTIHETVDAAGYEDFLASTHAEMWFVIEPYNVASETTYYFRLDIEGDAAEADAEIAAFANLTSGVLATPHSASARNIGTVYKSFSAQTRNIGSVFNSYATQVRNIGTVLEAATEYSAQARIIGTVYVAFAGQVRNIGTVLGASYSTQTRNIGSIFKSYSTNARNIGSIFQSYTAQTRLTGTIYKTLSSQTRNIGVIFKSYSTQVRNAGTVTFGGAAYSAVTRLIGIITSNSPSGEGSEILIGGLTSEYYITQGYHSSEAPTPPVITVTAPSQYYPVKRKRRISLALLSIIKQYLELKQNDKSN